MTGTRSSVWPFLSSQSGITCLLIAGLNLSLIHISILIPKESYDGYKGHYIKYAMRNAMDIATLGCSVNVKLSADRQMIEDARIAYGVACLLYTSIQVQYEEYPFVLDVQEAMAGGHLVFCNDRGHIVTVETDQMCIRDRYKM